MKESHLIWNEDDEDEPMIQDDNNHNDLFESSNHEEHLNNENWESKWNTTTDKNAVYFPHNDRSCIDLRTISPGDGITFPNPLDSVVLKYTAYQRPKEGGNWMKFTSDSIESKEFHTRLGNNENIIGLEQAILSMSKGQKCRLWVPSRLGYGLHGADNLVPPYTDLVFEVTLMDTYPLTDDTDTILKRYIEDGIEQDDDDDSVDLEQRKKTSFALKDERYNCHIYKLLKQVHPELSITVKAMRILNAFCIDIFNRIALEANNVLNKYTISTKKDRTMSARHIQTATTLCLFGELEKQANNAGYKAIVKYHNNVYGKKFPKGTRKSKCCGLTMSVGKIAKNIRESGYVRRNVGSGVAIYLAAVLEYTVCELIDIAGFVAKDNKKVRITPRHIKLAIENDAEFKKLLNDTIIPSGGVQPFIRHELLPNKKDSVCFKL